jgi:hypothetical protein
MKRIDNLEPETPVRLRFCGGFAGNQVREEDAVFVQIVGEGNDRRATFRSSYPNPEDGTYEWDAYRYNRRWAYGSSAEPLRLLEVKQ